MNTGVLAAATAAIVGWMLVSQRAERTNISGAFALVVAGVVLANGPLKLIHFDLHATSLLHVAEVTLAIVLFGDASRVRLGQLRHDLGVPERLLGIGLPLSIALGFVVAAVVLPSTGLWVAATIAAIVAPTDAALGAPILVDERVPLRIRRTLNVESGLNDGIATPFVNVCLAAAVASEISGTNSVRTAIAHLVVGAVVGTIVGLGGGLLVRLAHDHDWMAPGARNLAALGLAVLSYSACVTFHGNGFIAAFVAGLAFGTTMPQEGASTMTLTEEVAEGMTLFVWFAFGGTMLVPAIRAAHWNDVLFAVLALTVIRMVPVGLALLGSGIDRTTVLFVGWFGPRGLASVVFTLIAVDTLEPADGSRVLSVASITVGLSVLAHGVSASPLARMYADRHIVPVSKAAPPPELRARTRRRQPTDGEPAREI